MEKSRIIGYNDAEYRHGIKMRIYRDIINEPEYIDVNDLGGTCEIRERRIICIPANRIKLERGWGIYKKPIVIKERKTKKQKKVKRVKQMKISTNEMLGLMYLQQLEDRNKMFIALRGW